MDSQNVEELSSDEMTEPSLGKREDIVATTGVDLQDDRIEVQKLCFAFIETMAVKCVLELRIPDIIHSHGSPMSLSQIAVKIESPSLNLAYVSRVMRLLVHKNVFTAAPSSDDQSGETLYGLTNTSRLLLHDSEMTMAPMFLMITNPWLMDPWHHLSAAITDGKTMFDKAYGSSLWELLSKNPELNTLFNSGIESSTKFVTKAFLMAYRDGFHGIETLVDVGGGKGNLVSEIVKANWPHIRGINFELQHVVEAAPVYAGVTHVRGDMFKSIPSADAIIMKSVLCNWSDEDCKKILINCRSALPETKGKLILVEKVVLQEEGEGLVEETVLKFDLLMMVHCVGGRERTKVEWTNLLEDAGFSQLKFIKTSDLQYVIEAYAS